jgi:hypothetical protein
MNVRFLSERLDADEDAADGVGTDVEDTEADADADAGTGADIAEYLLQSLTGAKSDRNRHGQNE